MVIIIPASNIYAAQSYEASKLKVTRVTEQGERPDIGCAICKQGWHGQQILAIFVNGEDRYQRCMQCIGAELIRVGLLW
jgi:hypothetical protein